MNSAKNIEGACAGLSVMTGIGLYSVMENADPFVFWGGEMMGIVIVLFSVFKGSTK